MADQYVNLRPGLNNVGNYQVSGIPFVTGSLTAGSSSTTPIEVVFPSVTQKIHVFNYDANYGLKVGFSANGVKNSQHFLLQNQDSSGKNVYSVEIRVKTNKIYLLGADATHNTAGIYIVAELTGITGYDLTTAYSGSAGIG
jgi:hypothetical protein